MGERLWVSSLCAVCGYASGSVLAVSGCLHGVSTVQLFGTLYAMLPYAGELGECCPGCDVEMGSYHHKFCPHEVCPCCDEYLRSCDCTSDRGE